MSFSRPTTSDRSDSSSAACSRISAVGRGRSPRAQPRQVDVPLPLGDGLAPAYVVRDPLDVVEYATRIAASRDHLLRNALANHVEIEPPEAPVLREQRDQGIDPLLAVEELPGANSRSFRDATLTRLTKDVATLADPADEQRADGVAGEE